LLFSQKNVRRGSVIAAAAGAMFLGAVGMAASAGASSAPAPNAHAEVTSQFGLVYTGFDAPNNVTIDLANGRFVITDTAPIGSGAGCIPTKAGVGQFRVTCQAPLAANGQIRAFRVKAGGAADVVTNKTAVGMRADGGAGNDRINGGSGNDLLEDSSGSDELRGNAGLDTLMTSFGSNDGLPDTLFGGAGDDDLQAGPTADRLFGGPGKDVLRGGAGGDELDGGSGTDTVTYLDNAHDGKRVVVTPDNVADDGARVLGQTVNEGDNVRSNIEDLVGNSGNDVLFGTDSANQLFGGLGNDVLIGLKGADKIDGGSGNDQLASNDLFGVPVKDGAIDTLNGGPDNDSCRVPFINVEADITISCESVNQD